MFCDLHLLKVDPHFQLKFVACHDDRALWLRSGRKITSTILCVSRRELFPVDSPGNPVRLLISFVFALKLDAIQSTKYRPYNVQ